MSDPVPHPRSPDPGSPGGAPDDAPAGGAVVPMSFRPALPAAEPPLAPLPARNDGGFALSLAADDLGARARGIPILGGLAAVFGISALFQAPLVLGPLAMLFGLAALCRRQVSLGTIGGVAGLVGLVISPYFWALLGLGWIGSWLWSWLLG